MSDSEEVVRLKAEVERLRAAQRPPRRTDNPTCTGCSALYWRGYEDAESYFWQEMGNTLSDENTDYWAALTEIMKTVAQDSRAYDVAMAALKKHRMEPQ